MARPRMHDDATREQLLHVAGRRLAAHGLDAVTVRGVAADAAVSTRAVYALFGSRPGLLRAMFRDGYAAFAAVLDAVPETADPVQDVVELGLAYRRSAVERPHLYGVMFLVDSAEFSPTADDLGLCQRTMTTLRDAVARCVESGRFTGDIDVTTRNAWALVHGLSLLEQRGLLGTDPDRTWSDSLHAAVRGWSAGA